MKKLIVFVTCQRTGSSLSAEIFYRHGMSLGPFAFFMASLKKPLGLCEAMPIFRIDHALHQIVYGFSEDTIPYNHAGRIMKERNSVPFAVDRIPLELVGKGVETIQCLTDSAPIAGFKHPASVLFWPYWQHVFSQIPDLAVFPIFLLRSPAGIAASYARRANRPEFQNAMFDLIEIYLDRMLTIHDSWGGAKYVIRFTDEHYRNDLQSAMENCGLGWNEEIFGRCYEPSATVRIDDPVNHPVQSLHERWLSRCPIP